MKPVLLNVFFRQVRHLTSHLQKLDIIQPACYIELNTKYNWGEQKMPISNFFIVRILHQIRLLNHYDEDDIDMMRYSLQAILWEFEKLVYIFIIFAIMGRILYFLVALVALLTIRTTAGGFHSKTAWGCFIWTLFGFCLAILALPLIPINHLLIGLLSIFCLGATLLAAPLRSLEKEAIQKKDKDKQKKLIACGITVVWLAGVMIYFSHPFASIILWTVVLQSLQLFIEHFRRKRHHQRVASEGER